jgi:hypothetical protein
MARMLAPCWCMLRLRHSIFRLKLLVPCSFIHVHTLRDEVLHFRFEAALQSCDRIGSTYPGTFPALIDLSADQAIGHAAARRSAALHKRMGHHASRPARRRVRDTPDLP